MDILDPDRGKMTIYGSGFQQVNLTPNGGVSPTVGRLSCIIADICIFNTHLVIRTRYELFMHDVQ